MSWFEPPAAATGGRKLFVATVTTDFPLHICFTPFQLVFLFNPPLVFLVCFFVKEKLAGISCRGTVKQAKRAKSFER